MTNEPLFCVILEGAVRLSLEGRPTIELKENDFFLVPAARDFTMSSLDGGPRSQSVHTIVEDETGHGDPAGQRTYAC
ncbi:hypothetical protein [Mesorhizobium sp. ISC11]|uniref:hypothetical protein n=1 Tax=Mesorhizobium sp. ISC11 TaxID=3076428 RepID=UPI0030711BF8